MWGVDKKPERTLQALEMGTARRSCRVSRLDGISNAYVGKKVNTEESRVENNRVKWTPIIRWPLNKPVSMELKTYGKTKNKKWNSKMGTIGKVDSGDQTTVRG